MRPVTEIEPALAKLPPDEQRDGAAWLDTKLAPLDFATSVEEARADEVKHRIDELASIPLKWDSA